MEIDQVETFLAVSTFGGFHRAAEALRVSQPAVSARIKALEESLGAKLFSRSRTGLTLSDAGKTFRPYAEQLLKAASQARQAVHELRPGSAGPLLVASALSISVYFLPDVLKRFQRAHPNMLVEIRSGHSKAVLEMVLSGDAEIGLARSLQHPEVETFSLRDDPLLLVAHPKHGPKHARRARLEDVAAWPLIVYERGSSDWTLTSGLFRRAGLVPNIAFEVDSIETAKRMVERGLGLAFLPQLAIVHEIRSGRLSTVKILDAEPLGRSLDVIHPRHRPLRQEARAFLEAMQETAKDIPPLGPKATSLRRQLSR
ncbi:MAG TPA: LysR family transcriptional regulator [Terriglobales bacterium]|nr:LysR family transcriptional regulator [Terriglobales bacterium]